MFAFCSACEAGGHSCPKSEKHLNLTVFGGSDPLIRSACLQMEEENQQLKTVNLKQTEQILQLQEKLQSEYDRLDGAGTLWKTRPPDSSDGV